MTPTQTRTYGFGTPSTRQLLLEAMLRAFAWLVSNVASMLATIFNRPNRDWHTGRTEEDHLPTPTDIQEGTKSLSSLDEVGGGGSLALASETVGVSDGANGAIWSGGPNREANASAEAATTAHSHRTHATDAPPPNGGGATRAHVPTMAFRWEAALTHRTVRTRWTTAPHLTCARCTHYACNSSPARGRQTSAHG